MSLYRRRSNGIWHTRFWVNGHEYRRSCNTTDRKAAGREARQIRAAVERSAPAPLVAASLEIVAAADVSEAVARGATTDHVAKLKSKWTVVLRNLPRGIMVGQINYATVTAYVIARRQAGIRGQTIVREVQALKRALRIAKRQGMIAAVPDEWPAVRGGPKDPKRAGKLVDPMVVRQWLAELPQDARDEATFIGLTGLRAAEVKLVAPDWIRETPGGAAPAVLRLPDWATKSRRERTVGLSEAALAIVSRRLAEQPGREIVFSAANHRTARALACKRLGIAVRISLRDLRHTFASVGVIATGGDLVAVQEALGHTDLRTTKIYLSSTLDRMQGLGSAVGAALLGTKRTTKTAKSRQEKR